MFGWGGPRRPEFVAFDAIGTLFPLAPLRPLVAALGLPPAAVEAIYNATLRDAFALAAVGDYRPFKAVMAAALDEVLADAGLSPPSRARAAVLNGMGLLTARPDAGAAFQVLRKAGIGVGVLTNGALRDTRALLQRTGLALLVDIVASTDQVGLAKPRPEVYDYLVKQAGVRKKRVALVSIHAWDVQGAGDAGLITAYVSAQRPFSPLMRKPDLDAPGLLQAARALAMD